ncbi:contact-dependent growth inhibition system immunity protein [Xenorhabdus innexi]|uniref:Immunity protein CdiI-o11 n=1 Tax=Xenorhabdus innexi TaxID=290109 RepID=A0A1N6N0S4_9GAMM|nr:contact-dependent growth inhibition system immunity protein [Xenorhabdus innexi]PHM30271.1 Immunity protein CdiI-o11 [Xenorhabdus innexi]SIP74612.1 conserved hypothetical protein [Xenorhabdus innexi]
MKFNQDQDYWVSIYSTEKFISVETYSGLGLVGADPHFPPHLLSPETDDQSLGEAIFQALLNSRTLTDPEERVAFFDLEKGKEQYAARVAMLMDKYGYKSRKALFRNMKNCGIHCVNNLMTISPRRHEKLEAWGRERNDGIEDVVLSVDHSPEEIGAGLRLALSRCR